MLDASGKQVDVPDADVPQAFLSRQYGLVPGSQVPIITKAGTVGTVAAEEAHAAFQDEARVASPDEMHKALLEAKYGGVGGAATALGEGAARGVSFGLTDPLAIGLAKELGGANAADAVREHLAAIKEHNPITSLAGEAVGAVAPLLVPGAGEANAARVAAGATDAARAASGLAEAGRTVGAIPRATAEIGALAERGAAAMMGPEASSVAGRVGQTIVKKAAGAAAEAAVFGAGQEASESALGDHELNAERMIAAVGHSALMGAVLGGGLAGIGKLGSEAGGAILERAAPKLSEAAGEQAWKALSPLKKYTLEAEKRAGGAAAVGRTLLEEGVIAKEGEGILSAARDVEDLLPRIQAARQDIGEQIGQVVKNSRASVSARGVFEPINALIDAERGKAGFEGVVNGMIDYRNSLARALNLLDEKTGKPFADVLERKISIQDFIRQRQALDELVYVEQKALDPKLRVQRLRDIRGAMHDVELGAIDDAAKQMGGAGAEELKALNKKYQHLRIAENAASDTQARMVTNRNLSLSDYGAALASASSGHLLAAPVTAIAHKMLREHGNAVAAVALDRLASHGMIRKVSEQVGTATEAAVAGLVRKETPNAATALAKAPDRRLSVRSFRGPEEREPETPRARYTERVAEVSKQVAAQRIRGDQVSAQLGLGVHAPKTTEAMARTAQIATAFLASKVPKAERPGPTLTPLAQKPAISDIEMSKFLRYAKAVDDPMSVLDDMHKGHISPESVEALRAVYPKLYDDIRHKVADAVVDRGTQLPYAKRVELGILFGLPTDPTMTPEFQRAVQATYGAPAPDHESGAAKPMPSGRAIEIAETTASAGDALEQGTKGK